MVFFGCVAALGENVLFHRALGGSSPRCCPLLWACG